jgi:ABC-type transport system substrate-binding protein
VPNTPALFTPAVRSIASIEVMDRETIRLHTREPNPLMRFDMVSPVILSHRIHGESATTADFNSGELMVGTGPYRFVNWQHGERIELARNEQWYGPAEPWDRVVYRYIPNPAARSAALLAGEVDLIDYVLAMQRALVENAASPEQMADLAKGKPGENCVASLRRWRGRLRALDGAAPFRSGLAPVADGGDRGQSCYPRCED